MKPLFTLDHIRAKPELYLPTKTPSAIHLAAHLAEFVLYCGARNVRVGMHRHDWVSLGADIDWVTPTLSRPDRGFRGAFTEMMPANLGIQNEIRFEPIVTAFSRSLAVVRTGEYI